MLYILLWHRAFKAIILIYIVYVHSQDDGNAKMIKNTDDCDNMLMIMLIERR